MVLFDDPRNPIVYLTFKREAEEQLASLPVEQGN